MDLNTELDQNEDSLLRLIEEFERYKLQYTAAYEYAQEMLVLRDHGFACPEKAALHEEKLSHAIQAYFQLRDQIDWWLEQSLQIVDALEKIERQESAMGAPTSVFNRERVLPGRSEEKPLMPFFELEKVF